MAAKGNHKARNCLQQSKFRDGPHSRMNLYLNEATTLLVILKTSISQLHVVRRFFTLRVHDVFTSSCIDLSFLPFYFV